MPGAPLDHVLGPVVVRGVIGAFLSLVGLCADQGDIASHVAILQRDPPSDGTRKRSFASP